MSFGFIARKNEKIYSSSYFPRKENRLYFVEGAVEIFFLDDMIEIRIRNVPVFKMKGIRGDLDILEVGCAGIGFFFEKVSSKCPYHFKGTIWENHPAIDRQFLLHFMYGKEKIEILYGFGIGNICRQILLSNGQKELAEQVMTWWV